MKLQDGASQAVQSQVEDGARTQVEGVANLPGSGAASQVHGGEDLAAASASQAV